MKQLLWSALALGALIGVIPLAAQRGGESAKKARPSDLMTGSVPEQDVTLVIHISSDLATAIEKDRRDYYLSMQDPSGITSLVPRMPTLADQILLHLTLGYFQQVKQAYPAASVKDAEEALRAAQKKHDDAVQVTPADVQKKDAPKK